MEEDTLTLIVGIVVVVVMGLLVFMRKGESRLPPGPRGWPIIGNLGLLSKGVPHQVLAQLSKQHGPLLYLQLGSKPTIVVSSVELAKEVLLIRDKVFADRPNGDMNKRLWWNKGIAFMPARENWREIRHICYMELFSPKRLLSYENVLVEETSSMLQHVYNHSVNSPSKPMDLGKLVGALNSNIMGQLLFSKTSFTYQDNNTVVAMDIQDIIHQGSILFSTPVVGDFIPSLGWIFDAKVKAKMDCVHKLWDDLFQGLINERRPNQPSELSKQTALRDFLDALLAAKESGKYKNYDSDASLKASTLDMLAGGVDTTSIFLEWAMAELLKNPTKLSKLQVEVEDVIGHHRMVTRGDMPNLPYLNAVCKEAFRLHPPVPLLLPRLSNERCVIAEYVIPSKTRMMVNVWAIGRDPSVWESPDEFLPERFINNAIDIYGHQFELLPFGSGRRICPGVPLATKMVNLALSNLVHAFDWSLPQGIHPEKLDMSEKHGATVCKLHPLLLIPKPRNIATFMDVNI